jgi:ankyrin repeat protein
MDWLMEHGADVHTAGRDGNTALIHAATGGHVEAMDELLVEQCGDMNAARDNSCTALKRVALIHAAAGGHVAAMELLVEHGADVNAAAHDGCTSLMIAASKGYVAVIELLVKCGADVNAVTDVGSTALMEAAVRGQMVAMGLLLKHGADVHAARDDGLTSLQMAASKGFVAAMKLLVMQGADVNAVTNDGSTALMDAASSGHVAAMELLVEQGADVNAVGNNGCTALMYAATRGYDTAAMELLVEHGADVNAVARNGWATLHFAAIKGHVAATEWLASHAKDAATLNAFTDVAPDTTPETEPIVARLMQLKKDRARKLHQAKQHQSGGQVIKAKEALAWVLERLPEDEEAMVLDGEVDGAMRAMQEDERASDEAMALLLLEEAGADGASGDGARKTWANKNKKRKKKKKMKREEANIGKQGQAVDENVKEEADKEVADKEQEEQEKQQHQQHQQHHQHHQHHQQHQQHQQQHHQHQHQHHQHQHHQHQQYLERWHDRNDDETIRLQEQLRCMNAEQDAVIAGKDALMAEKDAEIARLKESLRVAVQKLVAQEAGLSPEVGLSPEYEELRAKFELLEEMYQPVQTENEQRKEMLTDLRKAAIVISRSRQDLHFPTKRMGEVDSAHLHRLGLSVEEISRLQQIVCDPNFYPWRTRRVRPGSEEVETVVHWADEKLRAIVQVYDRGANSKGQEVAEEVLRRSKELQQWNPSGGYCVTIPYHYSEKRELKPVELLKIAAGIDVARCRAANGNGNEGAGAGAGGAGHASPPEPPAPQPPRAPGASAAASWSRVVSSSR